MRHLFTLALLALVVTTAGSLACSASSEPSGDDDTSTSELRTLSSDEIAGTIEYGTKYLEVVNPGDRGSKKVYRAVRFEGKAGDEIVASAIGGNAADEVLYLLGDRFGTVASNDDREPGAKDSRITRKLTRSGTYYLAFRTKEGWWTKFYISLTKQGAEPPPPPPAPPAPTWKTGLAGFNLWGAEFKDALPSPSAYSSSRKTVLCKIVPSSATIACGTMFDSTPIVASIGDDGAFSMNAGAAGQTGGELVGHLDADGKATLTRFRQTECFQTSSRWCESQETDGSHLPAVATPYRLCRTKDQHFQSGGWASGFYVDCSKCDQYASSGGYEG